MTIVDSAMTREVMRDISKRPVDISNLDVHVTHGVVYLRGYIDRVRNYHEEVDLESELNIILKLLHQKSGVRDVCCEVQLAAPSVLERMKAENRRRGYYR